MAWQCLFRAPSNSLIDEEWALSSLREGHRAGCIGGSLDPEAWDRRRDPKHGPRGATHAADGVAGAALGTRGEAYGMEHRGCLMGGLGLHTLASRSKMRWQNPACLDVLTDY